MQVSYGGVTFQIVKTNSYHREPVLSDDKTELLYMNTTYDLTMLWNGDATAFVGEVGAFVAQPGANPGETDKAIRYHLLKPRLTFTLRSDDGDLLMTVPEPGFDRDPNHGPKPVHCDPVAVGPTTWRVNWRVVVASIECGAGGSPNDVPPILSNRYSQYQETGLDRLTRVTTQGVTVFRADALANLGRSADYYRSRCIPGLPLSFVRQMVSVKINPAGTCLMWTTVDQEVHTSIGATNDPRRGTVDRFEASFSMSSIGPEANGVPSAYSLARFDGFAWGNKDSSRAAMFSWLARLAVERMSLPNGKVDPSTQPMILKVTTSEKIDSPYVELHVDAKFPPPKIIQQGLGPLRVDFLGVDVIRMFANDGTNPQMPGDNNTRGTADVLAFAAAIKEACAPVPYLPSGVAGSGGDASDNYLASTIAVEVSSSPGLDSSTSSYSPDSTSTGTYSEMSVQSTWKTSTGRVQAQITGPTPTPYSSGSSSSGSTSSESDTSTETEDEPTCEILTLAMPITEVAITFECERTSVPPIIPAPNSYNPNLVLLDETIAPMAVGVASDGFTPVYRIGGTYHYAAKRARKPGAPLLFGVHPFTTFTYADSQMALSEESYSHGIVDPTQPPSPGDSGNSPTPTPMDDGGDSGSPTPEPTTPTPS